MVAATMALLVGAAVYAAGRMKARLFQTEVRLASIDRVSPGQEMVTVTSTGYVVPQRISKVGARVTGRIARVLVREGDEVEAGSTVAVLDGVEQESLVASAQSRALAASGRVVAARAGLADLRQQATRARALVEGGAAARATLEDLEAKERALAEEVNASDMGARAAQADVAPLQAGLRDRTILAPIKGTVMTKPVELGEIVGPQTEILEIADFSSLMVETDVPEARLSLVKTGGPCEIVLDAYPSKRFRGETVEIGRRVDRAKATVKVKVKFLDDAKEVLPDMSARTSFLSAPLSPEAINAKLKTIVPAAAVVERSGRKLVWAAERNVVHPVPVQLGGPAAGGFELLGGPPAGTRVVVDPPPDLTDGQAIKTREN
jgi:RND family efflux transporter MFP subunit